jgi:predicted TPR repeat methyltransferase
MSAATCRSCGSGDLVDVLALGDQPFANNLRRGDQLDQPEPTAPLDLVLCTSCSLFQLVDSVAPEILFADYKYFSSVIEALVEHVRVLADRLVTELDLGPDSLVVELASNDGYLLQHYLAAGVPVLGVEPVAGIAAVAQAKGIPTRAEFFGSEVARQMADEGVRADVLHANNVLAHVPDLNGFVEGIATLVGDEGLAVIEAPYVKDLLDHVEFDTIYHEHLCYFSLTAVDRLLRRHGLAVEHVERIPIHGGSLRYFARSVASARPDESVTGLMAEEEEWGVQAPEAYLEFARRTMEMKERFRGLLTKLREDGASVAAYGAAAKGSTLLNTFDVGTELLDYVVDASPHKQGLHMPGNGLPIVAPSRLLEDRPDYVVLLAWNFADEILAQQREYQDGGGRFIVPIPEPRVL